MNKKSTDIICYLSIIGFFISIFAGDFNNSKFHLNQSLVINIGIILARIVSGILNKIPYIGYIFSISVDIIIIIPLIIALIYGLVSAINEEERSVPILGDIKLIK
ncbi:MAG: hypothetical protein ACI4DS_04650 [Eubacterium sp.]